MVLGYHMLRLSAVRQLWSLSVPGCRPAPRRSVYHCLENVSSKSRKKPLFMEQLPDAGHRRWDEYICVSEHACVYFSTCMPLLYHIKQSLCPSSWKNKVEDYNRRTFSWKLIFFVFLFWLKLQENYCCGTTFYFNCNVLLIKCSYNQKDWFPPHRQQWKRMSCVSVQPSRRWKADRLLHCFWNWLYYLPP